MLAGRRDMRIMWLERSIMGGYSHLSHGGDVVAEGSTMGVAETGHGSTNSNSKT